jgi:hypothetical protein
MAVKKLERKPLDKPDETRPFKDGKGNVGRDHVTKQLC